MHYVYLDQNIIDRIDKGIKNDIAKFLDKNTFVPVVSIVSLMEMERGKQIERTFANIQSLIDIGSWLMWEEGLKILIVKPTRVDRVYNMMLRKDYIIYEIVNFLNTNFSRLHNCKPSIELREFLIDSVNKAKFFIDKLDIKHEKIKNNLFHEIDNLNNLIDDLNIILEGSQIENYSYINDLLQNISLNPREINNLNPDELWKKLEPVIIRDRELSVFGLSEGSTKHILYKHLLMLNDIGYWSDNIKNENRGMAFHSDCLHGFYGSFYYGVISSDKRFLKRLKAAYYRLSIPTKTFHFSGNIFNELD